MVYSGPGDTDIGTVEFGGCFLNSVGGQIGMLALIRTALSRWYLVPVTGARSPTIRLFYRLSDPKTPFVLSLSKGVLRQAQDER